MQQELEKFPPNLLIPSNILQRRIDELTKNTPPVKILLLEEKREDLTKGYISIKGTLEKKISQVEDRIIKNREIMAKTVEDIQKDVQLLDELNSKFVSMCYEAAGIPLQSLTELIEYQEPDIRDISGIGDRMVISIGIKIPSCKLYHLDPHIDTGEMSSC